MAHERVRAEITLGLGTEDWKQALSIVGKKLQTQQALGCKFFHIRKHSLGGIIFRLKNIKPER
jgi:hypothetical protein